MRCRRHGPIGRGRALATSIGVLALVGCHGAAPRIVPASGADLCAAGETSATVDARYRHEEDVLSRRMMEAGGRDGYHAAAALRQSARDRDDLLVLLLDRDRTIELCVPPSREREAELWRSSVLLATVARGHSPDDPDTEIVVHDVRLPPRAMPFADRACSGHGLEGAAACLVLVLPAGLADIATLPVGTWFYAGRTDEVTLSLDDFPPPAPLLASVETIVRRRTLERTLRAMSTL